MHTLTFRHALEIEVASLQAAHPILADALGRAHALLLDGKVFPCEDGLSAEVGSSTDPAVSYLVNGSCPCKASEFHAEPCKHRLAFRLYQRVVDRLTEEEECYTVDLAPESVGAAGIDPRFVTHLHGKQFVLYAGLLAMAHARGLVSLKASFISVTADLALAEAHVCFRDGSAYSECADSTPQNVPAHIRPHFPRMALTRAKARCLRDALNVSMVALEEMAEAVQP